ncbi:hypothetical protein HDU92_001121 [Lobulomyces angularis]|nr:hypothetical protein HDU92_001121 [Lobulomyces angularis]
MFSDIKKEAEIIDALNSSNNNLEEAINSLLVKKRRKSNTIDGYFIKKTTVSDSSVQPCQLSVPCTIKFDESTTQKNAFSVLKWSDATTSSTKPKILNAENVSEFIPGKLLLNFLPSELADELLLSMISKAKDWKVSKFIINKRQVESMHTTCLFAEDPAILRNHYYYGVNILKLTKELAAVKGLVDNCVNETLSQRKRLKLESQERWISSLALGNYYEDETKGVGLHSDKLEYIGPHPTIASLTLGAERLFKIKKIPFPGSPPETFHVMLPHNSLFVMLPGFQEGYKHEIPKQKVFEIKPNKLSGMQRVNFTFRMIRKEYFDALPYCFCGRRAVLKVVFKKKDNFGKHFYFCGGVKVDDENTEVDKSDSVEKTESSKKIILAKNCTYFKWLEDLF